MEKIKFVENTNKKTKPVEIPAFGTTYTNYIFEMDYDTDKGGWHSPTIKPFEDFMISPAALCFHYGQTIFEGLKGYRINGENILFRADANYKRLNSSCKRMRMPEIDVDFMVEATKQLILAENGEWFYDQPGSCLYIRPVMFASEPSLSVKEADKFKLFVMLSPMAFYFSDAKVNLVTEVQDMRVPANGTGEVKSGGNYGGSFSAAKRASDNGYSQVLWLDPIEQKYVEEAGMMNIFFVKDNQLLTPKLNGSILPGITRDSVIKIAKDLNLEVNETQIDINDIIKWYQDGSLTEAFASGTAASIQALDSITHNDFKMEFDYTNNKVYQKIYDYLEDIRYSRVEDKYGFVIKF